MRRPRAYAMAAPDSIGTILRRAAVRLGEAGIVRPQAEARLLLEAATGLTRASVIGFPERPLAPDQLSAVEQLVVRRVRREPVSRILGRREFWSLSFRVNEHTLDPRADSETLVEAVLVRVADRAAPLRLLDLGTGTGCLLLALLSELPNAQGTGIDFGAKALEVAGTNAESLGLADRTRLMVGNWGCGIASESFDIVVSNPPYIETAALPGLDPEVAQHDPKLALDGGVDGLDAYRRLAPDATRLLDPDGLLALEIGEGQGEAVRAILERAGMEKIGSAADLAGIERCVLFRRQSGGKSG